MLGIYAAFVLCFIVTPLVGKPLAVHVMCFFNRDYCCILIWPHVYVSRSLSSPYVGWAISTSSRFALHSVNCLRLPPILVSSLNLSCTLHTLSCVWVHKVSSSMVLQERHSTFLRAVVCAARHRISFKLPQAICTLEVSLLYASVFLLRHAQPYTTVSGIFPAPCLSCYCHHKLLWHRSTGFARPFLFFLRRLLVW